MSSPQSVTNSSFSESQLGNFKEETSLIISPDKYKQDSCLDLKKSSDKEDIIVKKESDLNNLSILSPDIIKEIKPLDEINEKSVVELATTLKTKKDGVAFSTDVLEAEKAKDEAKKTNVANFVENDNDYDAEIDEKPIDKSPGFF